MNPCSNDTKSSEEVANDKYISPSSALRHKFDANEDEYKTKDCLAIKQTKETTFLSSAQQNECIVSAPVLEEFLSISSNPISNNLENNIVEPLNPGDIETMNISSIEVQNTPKVSDINDKSTTKTSEISVNIADSDENVCMRDIIDAKTPEQAITKINLCHNDQTISLASTSEHKSDTHDDKCKTENCLDIKMSGEVSFTSSAELNGNNTSDAFLDKFLPVSSENHEKSSENHEKYTTKTCNLDNIDMDVSSIEIQNTPIDCDMENKLISKNSEDSKENISLKVDTDAQILEQSRINTLVEPSKNGYRCQDDSWSDDDETSSSSSDSSSDSDTFFESMRDCPGPKTTYPLMKTKGELDLNDLPLIEDLVISVDEKEMEKIGKVYAIVEKLVVIRALKDMKPLDLESVLFLSHDNPLGRVFDVFGPVVEPFYSVRFNSEDHIHEKGVKVDADVFFAPGKDDITSYVFVNDLQNQKGSDASWRHNNEPPEQFLDYSDDEQERAARRKRMMKNRNQHFNNSSNVDSKRPFLAGDSSDRPIFIPPPRPVLRRNLVSSTRYYRPNPFSAPRPILSPAPSFHRVVVSPSASPFSIPQHNQMHLPFTIQSPPPPLPYQQPPNILQRHPQSPMVFATHQQPVFGQVSMLSPALHTPPPFQPAIVGNMSSLIPAAHLSPVNPQNYFNQRFSRSPSPALHNGSPMSPDPWLPNRAPYQQSNLPPNAPLTVQIPPNISSPSIPIHPFDQVNNSVQPFVNHQNINFPPPYANHQNLHFPNGNVHPRFY